MRYHEDGTIGPRFSEADRKAAMARLRAEDDERERNRQAWNRLCGSMAPIGRVIDL